MADAPFAGIDIKTMAGLPDNFMILFGPSQIAVLDAERGVSATFPYGDVHKGFAEYLGREPCRTDEETDPYSVSTYSYKLSAIDYDLIDNFHDLLEESEDHLRDIILRKQDRIMKDILGSTQTSTIGEPHKPFDLDDMMEAVDRVATIKLDSDKRLIEAFLAAGCNVRVGDHSGRPEIVLPKEMAEAAQQVKTERRNRDYAENFYRDGMGLGIILDGTLS